MGESEGDRLRAAIAESDQTIRDAIADRIDLVTLLHIWKHENDLPVYDPVQEDKVIAQYVEDFGKEDGTAIARAIIGNYSE